MKKLATLILTILFSFSAFAGGKAEPKTVKFHVDGVCGMCETRIESALRIKGVKFADWNVETKELTVIYQPDKVTEEQLHQAIANVGHDTHKVKASTEAYGKVHECCRYREMDTH